MSENNPTIDQIDAENAGNGKLENNLKSRTTWLRLVFMCVFGILASLVGMVATVVVVLSFFWVLFTGEVNRELRQVGSGMATYMYQIISYLTFNTDDKPFPFGLRWPLSETEESSD